MRTSFPGTLWICVRFDPGGADLNARAERRDIFRGRIYAPENGWLEYDRFLLGRVLANFQVLLLLVSGRVRFFWRRFTDINTIGFWF